MMKLKRVIKNRKGLSPLFVSIYLAILAILLISMLWVAVDVSRSALSEQMRIEQERMQENVALLGPEALQLTGSTVESIRVNNTGSITVRIRALYIDHKFICDPSEFEGDAYIEPKEALWIQLIGNVHPSIVLDEETSNAYWTVTTERGTEASEIGGNLIWGEPGDPYSPKKFYFGPLMLVFDMFHWRSGSGPWRNGWTIPKGTKNVTWRILLVNVDDRDIIINEKSCFTLISNHKSPSDPLPWYIDPNLSETTLEPGIFNFVYYKWNKPFSEGGAKERGITGITESITCINFLTFFGSFVEADDTLIPFGQTIPFEAVLITDESMASSLELTSDPENIINDGMSTSTITATVKDSSGQPVSEAWVDFYTTAGELSETHGTTDVDGVAVVNLISSTSMKTAYVTAMCHGVEGTCRVAFTPAYGIRVEAAPSEISKNGGTSQITVQLIDENDVEIAQSGITLSVDISSWTGSPSKKPQLSYEEQIGYSVMATTDSNGQAIITLTAQGGTGTATITASSSGLSSGVSEVSIID